MKYKVAIVDEDQLYLGKIERIFGEKYADRMIICSYSSLGNYEKGKEENRFDLVLFSEGIIAPKDIPEGISAAYLVGQNDIDKIEQFSAVCKFQKHEILFKQIMELCLEQESTHYTKKNVLGNTTNLIYVTSAQGGVGVSTIAVSTAKNIAAGGSKVLYLSLEMNAVTDMFFKSEEDVTFSDVIYTIKSKKSNLVSRLENIVQKDESGVYFFGPCRTVFDRSELNVQDTELLIREICAMGSYEYIIVDAPLDYGKTGYFLCDFADTILIVTGAGRVYDKKLMRLKEALDIWDAQNDARLMAKASLIYNKYDNKVPLTPHPEFKEAGKVQRFENMDEKAIAANISAMGFLNTIR